jgi:hypothetical protein
VRGAATSKHRTNPIEHVCSDISIPSNPSKNSLKSTGLGAAGASVSNFCWNHHSKGVHTGKLGVNYHF